MQLAVSELGTEKGQEIVAQNLDATTPENAAVCKELGFKSHGIVIRNAAGETLWSQPDHAVVLEEVRGEVNRLIQEGV